MDNSSIDKALERFHPEIEERFNFKRVGIYLREEDPTLITKVDAVKKRRKKLKLNRKISRVLIDKCSKIEKLGYWELFPQLSEIIKKKDAHMDDEIILEAVYNHLENAFGEIKYDIYHKLLEDYDYILKKDPSYRDHLFHTFHVFLMGCMIIDKLYSDVSKSYEDQNSFSNKLHKIEYAWLLISNFHDIAIPIQNAGKMIHSITKKFFSVDSTKNYFDIISSITENDRETIKSNIQEMLKIIPSILHQPFKNSGVLGYQCNEQLYNLNHAVLGSTFLIQSMTKTEENNGLNLKDINNFALPIFVHDFKVWRHFPNKSISLKDFPLGFILLFCDNIQDFNRVNELNEQFRGFVEILNIDYDENRRIFTVELGYFDELCYKRKCAFTKNVINVLDGERIDFHIVLSLLDENRREIVSQPFCTSKYEEPDEDDKEFYAQKNENC